MDAVRRLLLTKHETKLQKLLDNKNNFFFATDFLVQEGVYNCEQGQDNKQSYEESNDKANIIDATINDIFNNEFSLTGLFSEMDNKQSQQLAQNFTDEKKVEVWENLIKLVKMRRKEELSNVPILPLRQNNRQKLDSFRVPLKLSQTKENVENEETTVELEEEEVFQEIFEKKIKEKKWIFVGCPGAGKTLQSQQIIYNWSNDKEAAYQLKHQLLLSINVSRIDEEANSLSAVVKKQNFNSQIFDYIREDTVEALLKDDNSKTTLLIDLGKECFLKKQWISTLLLQEKYPIRMIIWVESLQNNDLRINAAGVFQLLKFNDQQIQALYTKMVKQQSKQLWDFNSKLRQLSETPKIAMIISSLWLENKDLFNKKTPYSMLDPICKYGQHFEEKDVQKNFFQFCFNNIIQEDGSPIQEFDKIEEIAKCYSNVLFTKVDDTHSEPNLKFHCNLFKEYFAAKHLETQVENMKKAKESDNIMEMENIYEIINRTKNPKIYNIIAFLADYCEKTYNKMILEPCFKDKVLKDKDLQELIIGNDSHQTVRVKKETLNEYTIGIIFKRFQEEIEELELSECTFRDDSDKICFFERISNCKKLKCLIFEEEEIRLNDLEMNFDKLLKSVLNMKKLKKLILKSTTTPINTREYDIEATASDPFYEDKDSATLRITLSNLDKKYGLGLVISIKENEIVGVEYFSIGMNDEITTGFVEMITNIHTLESITLNNKILKSEFCKQFFHQLESLENFKKYFYYKLSIG
ncbi:unnamed protein product [Dimorphilus gyrociliatus]|uniref:Uncharacterized protein n=1 Tax=Dimorphilus gyrociliatus TaxID=2664684 RepID=A0A7I8WE94_9ANNE|nr:unnamed protein product [Dimorphilus gyrociliatus]